MANAAKFCFILDKKNVDVFFFSKGKIFLWNTTIYHVL